MLLQYIPRDQFLILPSEFLQESPEEALAKILEFIGINGDIYGNGDVKNDIAMNTTALYEAINKFFPSKFHFSCIAFLFFKVLNNSMSTFKISHPFSFSFFF